MDNRRLAPRWMAIQPNAGWKSRGVWATTGTRVPFHMEGGKGTLPMS